MIPKMPFSSLWLRGLGRSGKPPVPKRLPPPTSKHYVQTESAGTPGRPVVNNCISCAFKNLLSYYGKDTSRVEATMLAMMTTLKPVRERYWAAIRNEEQTVDVGLTWAGAKKYLELLATNPTLIAKPKVATPKGMNLQGKLARQAVRERKPFVLIDFIGSKTLAGDVFEEFAHCYVAYPARSLKPVYWVADSNYTRRIPVRSAKLLRKIVDDRKNLTMIIQQPPKPALLNAYFRLPPKAP